MIACHVREATLKDLDIVCHLDSHHPRDELVHTIECGNAWLAEIENETIGCAFLVPFWPRMPYLGLIWVRPEYRGAGVGASILQVIRHALERRGCTALLSSSCADEPEPQHWHRRMGFRECGFLAEVNGEGVGEVFFLLTIGS